jgi:hypothetical protein
LRPTYEAWLKDRLSYAKANVTKLIGRDGNEEAIGPPRTIAKNPKINRADALRQAMLATMEDRANPEWANPSSWAPFVLVGEGGAMTR